MKNKQVQPSWGRVFLVLALGMVLFALAHQLVAPTWAHMMLQIGIMLLTYILTLAGYEPPDTAELGETARDSISHKWSTFTTDNQDESATRSNKITAPSLKGKSS